MAAPQVHPLAYVAPAARLGEGVRIGPFCTVGPDVVLVTASSSSATSMSMA